MAWAVLGRLQPGWRSRRLIGCASLLLGTYACLAGIAHADAPAVSGLGISGTAAVGQQLTAEGTWTSTESNPAVAVTYQWQDCDSGGAGCSNAIGPGATAQTYTVVATDSGHTLEVIESGTDSAGDHNSFTSAPTAVVPVLAPVNTKPPSISGTAKEGQVLTLTQGTWSDPAAKITDQWESCKGTVCAPVNGGTTYTVQATDAGNTIVVSENASNAGGTSPPTTSNSLGPVVPLAPTNTTPPTISGTPQQGQTLTATTGTWTGSPTSYRYQWKDCNDKGNSCTNTGTDSASYILGPSDVGHTIVVDVTATNAGGSSAATPSAPSQVVLQLPPSNIFPPSISGIPQQSQQLTVTDGQWTNGPTSIADTWERCDASGNDCAAVQSGGATYTLSAADVGHAIVISETASNAGGTSAPVSSRPTPVVVIASGTTLFVVPGWAVANETVALVAVLSSLSGSPSGVVTFENGGNPVPNCVNVPAVASGQNLSDAVCQPSFASSIPRLTAVFTPSPGSGFVASTSAPYSLLVAQDSSSTALNLSSPNIEVGGTTTYTATVSPDHSGPVRPSGTVAFLDGGTPIAACSHQPLSSGLTATCTVGYGTAGGHTITARYSGDANFGGSTSSAAAETVSTPPPRILGTIHSTMQWTFAYTRSYTRVVALAVNGVPIGATVVVSCHGHGCPFVKHTTFVTKARRCAHKCAPKRPGTIDLAARFHQRRLRVGARITVEIIRPGWIGKYYGFTIRSRRVPRIQISCLAPGGRHPGVGC